MNTPTDVDSLSLQLGDLTIHISRSPDRRGSQQPETEGVAPSSAASVSVVSESPSQGALARPSRGTSALPVGAQQGYRQRGFARDDCSGEAWSWEWEAALLAARTPADFEQLDLSPIRALVSRLRACAGGWTPTARLGRALRAGLIARSKIEDRPGIYDLGPDIPLENRFYIIARGHSGRPAGWTDHYSTFLEEVRGLHSRFHRDVVCHSFASRTEAEAYCIGAGIPWPGPLQRRQ